MPSNEFYGAQPEAISIFDLAIWRLKKMKRKKKVYSLFSSGYVFVDSLFYILFIELLCVLVSRSYLVADRQNLSNLQCRST